MGEIRKTHKVLLFIGVLYTDETVLKHAEAVLKDRFGGYCLEYSGIDFDATDFYDEEMGERIKKAFFFFDRLISIEEIADIKIYTNLIEKRFAGKKGERTVNLDPGYLDMAKVILVTTKDRGHRIYLRDGILAETELIYFENNFQTLPWTYPDYKKESYNKIFSEARKIYHTKRENEQRSCW